MYKNNISVIVTTYNGAKYIEKQIDSILKQTLLPQEIIICDDNSKDGTAAILKNYENNDKIKILINDLQLGVVANFKKAASLAREGNYIAFADQDDIWVADKLKILADELALIDDVEKPALVFSDLTVIDKNDEIVAASFWDKQQIQPERVNLERMLFGNIITGCTIMINNAMKLEFLNMDNYSFLHDEWMALIAYSFGNVSFIKDKLVLYRQHESNVTYAENIKPQSKWGKFKDDIDYALKRKPFLKHQFALANFFFSQYHSKFNNNQLVVFKSFIQLEKKSYFAQRIKRRNTHL